MNTSVQRLSKALLFSTLSALMAPALAAGLVIGTAGAVSAFADAALRPQQAMTDETVQTAEISPRLQARR